MVSISPSTHAILMVAFSVDMLLLVASEGYRVAPTSSALH